MLETEQLLQKHRQRLIHLCLVDVLFERHVCTLCSLLDNLLVPTFYLALSFCFWRAATGSHDLVAIFSTR